MRAMSGPRQRPYLIALGSPARFPPADEAMAEPNGLLAIGGDLEPERLRAAYRQGIFPWFGEGEPILWWSPDPRCLFRTDAIRASRRLRQRMRNAGWTLSMDRAFAEVMAACAAPRDGQPETWITARMLEAYLGLHAAGQAHSVEVWEDEALIGGIYGVATGCMFAGESMFSCRPDASKVALFALATALRGGGFPWLDAQVPNPHLASLGAIEMPRAEYLRELVDLVNRAPCPAAWQDDLPSTTAQLANACRPAKGPL